MKKIERSPLDPFVKWFFPKLLPFVPAWMSANAITSIGIVLCFLSGLCLALTEYSPRLYYLAAFLFFLTWVTDTLDGVVARARKHESRLGHYLDLWGGGEFSPEKIGDGDPSVSGILLFGPEKFVGLFDELPAQKIITFANKDGGSQGRG